MLQLRQKYFVFNVVVLNTGPRLRAWLPWNESTVERCLTYPPQNTACTHDVRPLRSIRSTWVQWQPQCTPGRLSDEYIHSQCTVRCQPLASIAVETCGTSARYGARTALLSYTLPKELKQSVAVRQTASGTCHCQWHRRSFRISVYDDFMLCSTTALNIQHSSYICGICSDAT